MATPNIALVRALRTTALRLESGANYRWSNFANCNCGNLAQTVTDLSASEIHRAAFQQGGDWGEQAVEYCVNTGLPIHHIFDQMLRLGLSPHDFRRLERLSDAAVVARVGRRLRHSHREDAVAYMRAWADLLEERLRGGGPAEAHEDEAVFAEAAE